MKNMKGAGKIGPGNGSGPTMSKGSAPSGGPSASRSVDTSFSAGKNTKASSGWDGRHYTPDSKC